MPYNCYNDLCYTLRMQAIIGITQYHYNGAHNLTTDSCITLTVIRSVTEVEAMVVSMHTLTSPNK